MDITLYEFNSLNEMEQAKALWEYGVQISERFDNNFGYSLFQINNFYVEVKYDSTKNRIAKFTSFASGPRLEPYIKNIDISDLK